MIAMQSCNIFIQKKMLKHFYVKKCEKINFMRKIRNKFCIFFRWIQILKMECTLSLVMRGIGLLPDSYVIFDISKCAHILNIIHTFYRFILLFRLEAIRFLSPFLEKK